MRKFDSKRILLVLFSLIIMGLVAFVGYWVTGRVKAAERTWTQTDWRGGVSAQVVTCDVTTFAESSNINYSNEGILTIDEKSDWNLVGWKYRRKITFNNIFDQLGLNPEVLIDFPIMIKLENGVNIDYSETNDNGSDIRFVDTDGTELSYEIENWDETGNSFIWVKVPQIDIGNEDFIYMYYSNSTAEDNQNVNDVWSNGFAAVWHLGEVGDGTVGEYYDSTGLGSGGTGGGGIPNSIPQQIGGFSGYAQRFDGVDDYINIGDTEPLRIGGDLTINMWLYPVLANSRQNPYAKAYGGEGTITQEPADNFNFYYGTAGGNASPYQGFNSSGTITEGEWNYVSLVRDLSGEMKLSWYIDGIRTAYANANYSYAQPSPLPATIGQGYAGRYNGYIDELWISNVARSYAWNKAIYNSMTSDFIQYQDQEIVYANDGYLVSNVFDAGYPSDWGNLQYISDDGITIKVRSANNSDMTGASDWSECLDINSNTNVKTGNCVTDEHRYIQYKVFIDMTGKTDLTNLDMLSISFSASDQTPPTTNATALYLGNSRDNGDWLNFEPTIIWTEGSDDLDGNGLEGYCIALEEVPISGVTENLDPKITSGILMGLDDGISNDGCPYIVSDSSIDLSEIDNLSLQSNRKYYFSIKAVDKAGNVWNGDPSLYQNLVWFKYDNTRPNNVMYISTPSSNFGNVNEMFFTWPIGGSSQAIDEQSGLLGWQYAINSSCEEAWRGSVMHDKLGVEYIPVEGSEGVHYLDFAKDGNDVIIGNNTIYFRAIDNAGNVSTYSTGGLSYSGQAPSFPAESIVTVVPNSSESNSYSLTWPEAQASLGKTVKSYYYMINTSPPTSVSTLVSNGSIYIPTVETSVEQGMLIGAVKGENVVYVVAIDSDDNYSPTNAIQGTFTLDSDLPDPPLNFSISDTSIKEAKLWRVALTWEQPVYTGNGDIMYIVEKSLDGITWTELDRITGNAYSDISESSREYYYRVATVDSSNESMNNPSYTVSLGIVPEGRFNSPAELVSKPVVLEVTTRMAKVSWSTDRNSDSKLQYGISSGQYFDSEIYTSTQTTEHILDMNNLLPGTTYYVRAKWTDTDGNTGISNEFLVQTKPAPVVEDVTIDSVGLNYAIIKLTTTGASKAQVIYGKTKAYGGSIEINTSTKSSEYSIMLQDLEDGTEYHYKIVLTDEEGFEYESFEDHVFSTPPRPQVSNVQIQEKRGVPTPTIEVFWESNIPVNSIVRYSKEGKTLDKVDMELIEGEHVMEIEGLDPDSAYQLIVEGVDAMGNRATSGVYAFTTATDTRPPEVLGIKSEGDIQSSDIQTDRSRSAQLIISWETDEPSTSQVLYGEGAANDGYPYSTQTDAEMRYKHVMIVSNLTPSKVYHFKVVSRDSAGNVGESGSVTSITPKSTDTVVDSVLGSLSRIFNFF
jgi:hypothetical protein